MSHSHGNIRRMNDINWLSVSVTNPLLNVPINLSSVKWTAVEELRTGSGPKSTQTDEV